ncbi:MAG: sigma-70 family RNA polymerase sigma factor [Roseovarius sp.]
MHDRDAIEHMIGRCALKDRDAFSDLYSATSAKLFGVILRVLNNRAEAEEVLQEVYVKIWRNAGRYRSGGFPDDMADHGARERGIDMLRKRKGTGEQMPEGLADAMPDSAPGPEAQAVRASEREKLDGCMNELEADRAEAVQGAYLDGETYADLAARFDVPLNTMRTWLRRSLLKLRECLSR